MIRNICSLILSIAAFFICSPSWAASLGMVKSFSHKNGSVSIIAEKGSLVITPFSPFCVKVLACTLNDNSSPRPSKSVVLKPDCKFSVADTGLDIAISLQGSDLKVIVHKADSRVSFVKNGVSLLKDCDSPDAIAFAASPSEAFYGTGERGIGHNLRGDTLVMYNKQNYGYGRGDRTAQMNISVPFFVSSLGYGVLFDDFSPARLILDSTVQYISDNSMPVPYFFIAAHDNSIAATVKEYTALTGRQCLPPFWSLGYITSKYGYKTQDETIATIDTLRHEGFPVDAIVLDLFWYGKETDMGRFEWNKAQWPDHQKMLADLSSKGVKTIIISQPYINKIGAIDNYNFLASHGMLATDSIGRVHDVSTWVGEAGMLDVSNPDTRKWLWQKYSLLTREGVAGWWGDLGEPEVHPLSIRHHNGLSAAQYHNVYGNDWSSIIFDGFKKEFPDTRLMTLMRGGTAGLQRYSVFPWSTDVSRSWEGLQAQIPIMINSALSGLGYMSHDVGGFAVDKMHPVNPQLYARWLQLGLFSPILRTHSTVDAEPYHYSEYLQLFRRIISDRYRWLPYNYSLAFENASSGAPFVRPLNFFDAADPATADITDEFLWGADVLVAPVINQDASSRDVYFPKGKWFNFNDPSVSFSGPCHALVNAPIDVIPLFARAGAIIPMADYHMSCTRDYNPAEFSILYFPADSTSRYSLFDDDRTSTNSLDSGKFQLIDFTARQNDEYTTIAVDCSGLGYNDMPLARHFTFKIMDFDSVPQSVSFGNSSMKPVNSPSLLADGCYFFDADARQLVVKVAWDYSPATLIVEKSR